jgi:hypothetical protein
MAQISDLSFAPKDFYPDTRKFELDFVLKFAIAYPDENLWRKLKSEPLIIDVCTVVCSM